MSNLAYPYQVAPEGRTATTDDTTHIRDMIEQVLFTAPGERVMRPDFGSGAARLVFAPNSVELASATQMLIQSALQQWLNAAIVVQSVNVAAADATLSITIQYAVRATGQVQQQTFQRSLGERAMIYHCCDARRRELVRESPSLNGIDYLEVIDGDLPAIDPLRQRTLLVHCLKPVPPFTAANVRISGGERITSIGIDWAAPATPTAAQLGGPGEATTEAIVAAQADATSVLVVRVNEAGDYSAYSLGFVASALDDDPPAGFDPQLSAVDFWFKVDCPSDFDCRQTVTCPPIEATPPEINYLARDYTTFNTLMLDRMAELAPGWTQSGAADYGQAVVELLAYVGDQVSYQQDAVATEAYLETARRRVSLRRLAVLVDYAMHDGCNARAWLQLQVSAPSFTPATGTQFLTRCPGLPSGIIAGSDAHKQAMLLLPKVFAPLEWPALHSAHNEIRFYTWSDDRCCLPIGATSATIAGSYPDLKAGNVLLFEEVMGPLSGVAGDADPTHRHVVRLTSVLPTAPATLTDPLNGDPITEIAWSPADALPFALCISSKADDEHGGQVLPAISVARGNLILVDHGQTVAGETIGTVPAPTLYLAPPCSADACATTGPMPVPARFRPTLAQGPLTQQGRVEVKPTTPGQTVPVSQPFDPSAPAADAMNWSMDEVVPALTLTGARQSQVTTWQAQRTLLNSGADANDFVVEVDDDGLAHLRFGDDEHGAAPLTGTSFIAGYRVGNGTSGNVGAETIVHVVASQADLGNIASVRNPLAAAGGVDPETVDSVRHNAPQAFRVQERAVTPADYEAVSESQSGVHRAAATPRWTGSWYTMFIAVDPDDGVDPSPLKASLAPVVDNYRMAGVDLEFDDPVYVPLEVEMHVCVADDYFRSNVEAALLSALGSKVLADGTRGLFHPDNFAFGQTVYLSPIYAAAHAVPGVASAQITTFQRQGTPDKTYLIEGEMPLDRLEIARLDNDANFPERGVLRLDLNGGK